MIHTEEKQFQCTQREKAFSKCSNLGMHMITHTGGKPYQCTHSEEAFPTEACFCGTYDNSY